MRAEGAVSIEPRLRVDRLRLEPIIRPHMDGRMGGNVNGPSLIKVPDWIERPLGKYYLYFAHHNGTYIRLAYGDDLKGPWRTHEAGALALNDSFFAGHIASPDVHVDHERCEIRMYFHGSNTQTKEGGPQSTRVATSAHGLDFKAREEKLGDAYFRVFRWLDHWYGLAMPGQFYRSHDGLANFERGPKLFTPRMRHSALKLDGNVLSVFFTNIGDAPERILLSRIRLLPDWQDWRETEPVTVLRPEFPFEGGDAPPEPSIWGQCDDIVCQLRDPAIFREADRDFLLYATAGESGIGLAEIFEGV